MLDKPQITERHGGSGGDEDAAVSAINGLRRLGEAVFSPRAGRPAGTDQDTAPGAGGSRVKLVVPGEGVYPLDPLKPATGEDDPVKLLRDIRELLRDMRPGPPKSSLRTRTVTLDTGANSGDIADPTGFSNVFIPRVPRQVDVYVGPGRKLFLGRLATGEQMNAELPYNEFAVYLEWGTGTAGEQIIVHLASDPLKVTIT